MNIPTVQSVTVTSNAPPKTITVQGRGTTVTAPGLTTFSTVTNVVTRPALTLTKIQSIHGPTVTSIKTVVPSNVTVTEMQSLNGPTIISVQTVYPSGNSLGNGTFVTPPVTVTEYASECSLPIGSATSSSSATIASPSETATASATISGLNVIASSSCANPLGYYIQVDNTGLDIDGTVLLGGSTVDDGEFRALYSPPGQGPFTWNAVPTIFAYDEATGHLSDTAWPQNTLSAYNSSGDTYIRGEIWSFPSSYTWSSLLSCTVGDGSVLACGAQYDGSFVQGLKIVGQDSSNYFPFLTGTAYLGGQTTYDATFSLIPACNSNGSSAAITSSSMPTSISAISSATPDATTTAAINTNPTTSATATPTPNLFILQATGDQSLYVTVDDTGAIRLDDDTSVAVPFYVDDSGQLRNWQDSSKLLVDCYQPDSSTADNKVYVDVPSSSNYGLTCNYIGRNNGDYYGGCQSSGPPDGNPVVYGFGTCPNEGYYLYMIPNSSNVRCSDGGYSFLGFYLVTYTGN